MVDLTLLQHAYPMADTIGHATDVWSHSSSQIKNHLARKITVADTLLKWKNICVGHYGEPFFFFLIHKWHYGRT